MELGSFPQCQHETSMLAEQLSRACTTLGPKGVEVAVIKGCIFQNGKQKKVAPRGRGWLSFEQLLSHFLLVKTATWPTETKTSASVASQLWLLDWYSNISQLIWAMGF